MVGERGRRQAANLGLAPKRYFWKSAKFVRRLEVLPEDRKGFWELNGYHDDADPWQDQRHWF
ncbi:MAG TPA: hypothetical protein VGJ70_10810 [Solirubrobacteraceae bacterium]